MLHALINSLVAYRGKPAKIVGVLGDKFEISTIDGKSIKVRSKDFRLLSPDFTSDFNSLTHNILTADFEILTELSEEVLSVEELSNWLFGEYSPCSSWQLFLLVEDGVHFYWQKDNIFIRPSSQVSKIKEQRQKEQEEEIALQGFLQRVAKKTFNENDTEFLEEIQKVALNQLKSSKILKTLKIPNTSEDAYKFLVDIGWYDLTHNPYPVRNKIYVEQDLEITEQEFDRIDLTHFNSYAIDNLGSTDADDGIAMFEGRIYISIADVGSFASDELLTYAEHRISNLYLPNEVIGMLPSEITEKSALCGKSNALTISFTLSEDCENIENIEVVKSVIHVVNTDYDSVDNLITTDFQEFYNISKQHKAYRKTHGSFNLDLPKVDVKLRDGKVVLQPQHNTKSRLMVAEFMILAGRVMSEFALQNEIPIPYVSQEQGNFSDELLSKKTLTMSESFASTKLFKRSKTSTTPNLHFGLGLDKYTRTTSPLRRYLDLLTHIQLTNFIANQPLLSAEQIKEKIGINNAKMQQLNQTTRDSNNHYKFLYILQHKTEIFDATIISDIGKKKLIMIEKLGMIKDLKTTKNLDEKIKISLYDIDIFTQELSVKEC